MTQSVLEKNLRYISAYNRELEKKISNITELQGNFELKYAKSGDAVLYKDNFPTDDINDPVWDAIEQCKKLKFNINKSITFVVGLGLGYRLKELANRHKGKIIVFEPDINHLRVVLELVDSSEFLQKDNVKLVSSYSELESIYQSMFFIHYKLNVLCSDYYLMHQAAAAREIKDKLEDLHSIYQSNYRNLFQKNAIWTELVFNNIPCIVRNPDLDVLKDKFQGKTAVIIAAGPSLDKNIGNLKPYRDKVTVFCVGTALKTALNHGITPDFTVAVETFKSTYTNLNLPQTADTNFILNTRVFPDVYRLKPKRIFNYHGQNSPASKWLGQILGKSFELYKEAGTVSLTAFYAAKLLGCDKFIFIGQDLAYSDNRFYSRDTMFGNYVVDNSKTVRDETGSEAEIKPHASFMARDMLYVKGSRQEKVLSSATLLLFIKYFEEIGQKLGPEVKLVNATEGGAYLEGFEHITLDEALEKYTSEVIPAENILKTSCMKEKDYAKREKIILDAMSNITKNFQKARAILKDTCENEIFPRFDLKDNVDKILEYREKLDINTLSFKNLKDKKAMSQEENDKIREFGKLQRESRDRLLAKIGHAFYNDFNSFSRNLKIVRDNYIKLEQILSRNPYLYNYYFDGFLTANYLIKDFDGREGCLKCMSNYLNGFMIHLYTIDIPMIRNMVNELESRKQYA